MSNTTILPPAHYIQQAAREFAARYPHHDSARLARAAHIAALGYVHPRSAHLFDIRSQSNARGEYVVDRSAKTCTCPDYPRAPQHICKHRLAAWLVLRATQLWEEQTRRTFDASMSALQDAHACGDLDTWARYDAESDNTYAHYAQARDARRALGV